MIITSQCNYVIVISYASTLTTILLIKHINYLLLIVIIIIAFKFSLPMLNWYDMAFDDIRLIRKDILNHPQSGSMGFIYFYFHLYFYLFIIFISFVVNVQKWFVVPIIQLATFNATQLKGQQRMIIVVVKFRQWRRDGVDRDTWRWLMLEFLAWK